MSEHILDIADRQIATSMRKFLRATSAFSEAIDESVAAVKLAANWGENLVDELTDDPMDFVKKHPVESLVATFAVGIVVGGVIGRRTSRR